MVLTIDDFLEKREGPPPERIYHTTGDLVPRGECVETDVWKKAESDASRVLSDRSVAASGVLRDVEDDDDRPEGLRLQVFATHKREQWEAFDAEMKAPSYNCAVEVGSNAHGVLKVTTEGKGVLFLMQLPCFWPDDLPHTSRPCVRLSSDERQKVLNATRLVHPKMYQVYHPHVLSTLCRLFGAQWVPSSRPTVNGTSKPNVFVKDLRLVLLPPMRPEIEWCFSVMGCSQAFTPRGSGGEGGGRVLPRSEWGETGTEDRQLCRTDVADHFDKAYAELKTHVPAHALRSVQGFLELSKCFKDKVLRPPTKVNPVRRPFPLLQPRMASGGAAPAAAAAPKPATVAQKAATTPAPQPKTAVSAAPSKPGTSAAVVRANALSGGPLSDSEESDSGDFLLGQMAKAAAAKAAAAKAPAPAPAPARTRAPAVAKPAAKAALPEKPTDPKPGAKSALPKAAANPRPAANPGQQKKKEKKKRKRDSDDEDDGEHGPGDVSDLPDESDEDEDDSEDDSEDSEDDEGEDDSEDDSNADDDAEAYDDGEDAEDEDEDESEEDRPVRERNVRRRTHKGAASMESSVSSSSSSSKSTVAPVPHPPAAAAAPSLLSADLQELTAPVRARVAKWQERSALSLSPTARERIDQYVKVLATGTSSVGMLSAALSLNDELLARLEDAPPPTETLTKVERDNVQALSRTAGAFAKGTLGKVRNALEESKRTTATLETVLKSGEDVLKTNIGVLEAFGRRSLAPSPAPSAA